MTQTPRPYRLTRDGYLVPSQDGEKSEVITLCGSMRFKALMLTVAERETAEGVIVLMPFSVVAPEDQGSEFKAMLDRLHRAKIDLSDSIVVVTDQSGYFGESTRGEIAYAESLGKPVRYRHMRAAQPATVDDTALAARDAEVEWRDREWRSELADTLRKRDAEIERLRAEVRDLRNAYEVRHPEDQWRVTVDVPLHLDGDLQSSLLQAVSKAVDGWQPEDRDGWDAFVSGYPYSHSEEAERDRLRAELADITKTAWEDRECRIKEADQIRAELAELRSAATDAVGLDSDVDLGELVATLSAAKGVLASAADTDATPAELAALRAQRAVVPADAVGQIAARVHDVVCDCHGNRTGITLRPRDLDKIRAGIRPLIESWRPATEPAEATPVEPRVFCKGDPEPDDVNQVKDGGDRRWCRNRADRSWYLRDIAGPFLMWDELLDRAERLTEVPTEGGKA